MIERLWNRTGMLAGIAAIAVCIAALTSSPAVAQNPRVPSDVRVINTSAQPVPVQLKKGATLLYHQELDLGLLNRESLRREIR